MGGLSFEPTLMARDSQCGQKCVKMRQQNGFWSFDKYSQELLMEKLFNIFSAFLAIRHQIKNDDYVSFNPTNFYQYALGQ